MKWYIRTKKEPLSDRSSSIKKTRSEQLNQATLALVIGVFLHFSLQK